MIWTQWYGFRTLGIFLGGRVPSGVGHPQSRSFLNTIKHTTLGRITLDERSARQRDIYLAQKTLRTYRHISFRRDKKSQKATGRRPTPWDRATTGIGTIDSGGRKITYPSSGLRDTIFSWTKIDILSSVNPLHASAEHRIAKKPRLKSAVISDIQGYTRRHWIIGHNFFILHKF
jgi:hypothetical protein